jgi:hypothetical protein
VPTLVCVAAKFPADDGVVSSNQSADGANTMACTPKITNQMAVRYGKMVVHRVAPGDLAL